MKRRYITIVGMIAKSESTDALYRQENIATKAIEDAATEIVGLIKKKYLTISEKEYDKWSVGIPTEVYTMLNSFDREAVEAAVFAWLGRNPDISRGIKAKSIDLY